MSALSIPRPGPVSVPRVRGMAWFNTRLMTRNTLTLLYAFILPLTPMALLFTEAGYGGLGKVPTLASVLLLALLFPVYYNTLSQVVSRRDELVLKRMRTSEATDLEILIGIALPGVVIAAIVGALAVPLALAAGLDLPSNPLLYAVLVLGASVMFSAFAFWTAAWTRNAEAAQLTSTPILLLAMVGMFSPMFPEDVARWVELTPGGLVMSLVEASWSGGGFVASWSDAGQPLLALVFWTAVAVDLARRSMRWEPRG
jgi:ABC-2 type transport system permease protein